MDKHTKKTSLKILLLVFVIVLSPFMFAFSTKAEEPGIIKVGVYELDGFHSFDENGNCNGYDVDYLSRISNITGWKYEYVKADSWTQAVDMLRRHQIDLLSPSEVTPDRLQEFGFSTFPIGKLYASVMTTTDNSTMYEDFAAFCFMKFGIERGSSNIQIFADYAKENAFTVNTKLYDNHEQLLEALNRGEVDAIVVNVMRADSNLRLIGKAGVAQFYYMYRKNDTTLAADINEALDQIEIDDPNFQSELIDAYFPQYNEQPFSKFEINYVKARPKIRIACAKNARPYSYIDEKTGEFTGILIDYLTESGKEAGIQYEFIPFEGQINNDDIVANKINFVIETGLSTIDKNQSEGLFSNSFLDAQQLIVCNPDIDYSIDKSLKIAWYGVTDAVSQTLKNQYPNFTWVLCNSSEECFEAVKSGEADACMVNQYVANWNLSKPRYEDLIIVSNSSAVQSLCLRAGVETEKCNPNDLELIKIINKCFKNVPQTVEQEIVIRYTTAIPYKLSFLETCIRYKYIIGLTALLFIVVSFSFWFYARNKSIRAHIDGLTGLYNRATGKKMITRLLQKKHYSAGALLMIDLDHFKDVNDTLGHQAGDTLLKETAQKLTDCCRKGDIVCRLGGDEFMIYYPCDEPIEFLKDKLERICNNLELTVEQDGKSVKVSCSIGVSIAPKDAKDYEQLYKCADMALYKTKNSGRNGFNIYENKEIE